MTWDEFLARRKDFFGSEFSIIMNPMYYRNSVDGVVEFIGDEPVERTITIHSTTGGTYTFAEDEATINWHRTFGIVISEKDGTRIIISI